MIEREGDEENGFWEIVSSQVLWKFVVKHERSRCSIVLRLLYSHTFNHCHASRQSS